MTKRPWENTEKILKNTLECSKNWRFDFPNRLMKNAFFL